MPVTEYDGVVINNVTLAKYKELKAANQIVTSQTYVITNLDEVLDELENEKYWQLRTGSVITNSDSIFFNTNKHDFSDVPLGNLIQKNDQNGNVYYLKFIKEGNTYKLVRANPSGTYGTNDVIASGTLTSINWNRTFIIYAYNYIGYHSKITVLISDKSIIDNLFRINNTNF